MCFGANFSSLKYFSSKYRILPNLFHICAIRSQKSELAGKYLIFIAKEQQHLPKIDPKRISRITRERGCGSALGVPWIRIRTWCCFNRKVNTQKCAWNQVKSVGKSCSGIVEASNFLFVGKIIMTDHVHITLGWVPKKSGDPIPSRRDAKCKCNRYPGCTRHKAQGTRHKGAIDCEANLETGLVAARQAGGSWEQGDPILSERDPDPATTTDLIRVSLFLLHQGPEGSHQ